MCDCDCYSNVGNDLESYHKELLVQFKLINDRLSSIENRLEKIEKQTSVTHDIGTQMSNFIPALAFLDQGIGRIKALPFDVMNLLPPLLTSNNLQNFESSS